MLKNILGVIVGYIAMFAFVFITFTGVYFLMGTEGAFQPGSYNVSTMWVLASIVLGFLAAILGGWVCAAITKNQKAAMALAGLVLVLGVLLAIPTLSQEAGGVRTGDVDNMTAMNSARQPSWLAFLNPLIGAAGVMLGAKLKKSPEQAGSGPRPEMA